MMLLITTTCPKWSGMHFFHFCHTSFEHCVATTSSRSYEYRGGRNYVIDRWNTVSYTALQFVGIDNICEFVDDHTVLVLQKEKRNDGGGGCGAAAAAAGGGGGGAATTTLPTETEDDDDEISFQCKCKLWAISFATKLNNNNSIIGKSTLGDADFLWDYGMELERHTISSSID